MSEFPASLKDRFQPVRLLGKGGFGEVWLALQTALERHVALKTLNAELVDTDEQVQRFRDEARLTASIRHPGVVTLLDHGVAAGTPWMAFEYVEGRSLRSWVESGPTPWREVMEVGRQVAQALEEARRNGIIHRDIKPDNILQGADGRIKIADFGIAKWAGNSTKTAAGMVLGTPAYLSPQQIKGHMPAHHSDLYALGITLFELLTGRTPFQDQNPILLLERHISSAPPRVRDMVPDVPESVDRLITRLLAKDREDRFDTAEELAQKIGELLDGGQAHATQELKLRSGRVSRPSVTSRGGVTRVASVRLATPFATKLSRGPLGYAAAALTVGALTVAALLWAPRPAVTPPSPSASSSPAAPPASGSPSAPAAAFDDLAAEAAVLLREGRAIAAMSPQDEAVFLGSGHDAVRAQVVKLQPLLLKYLHMLRRALAYDGPHAARTLVVITPGLELIRAAQKITQQTNFMFTGKLSPLLGSDSEATLKLLARELKRDPSRRDDVYRQVLIMVLGPALEALARGTLTAGMGTDAVAAEQNRASEVLSEVVQGLPDPVPGELAEAAVAVHARATNSWHDTRGDAKGGERGRRIDGHVLRALRRGAAVTPRFLTAAKAFPRMPFHDEACALLYGILLELACHADSEPAERGPALRLADQLVQYRVAEWDRDEDVPWLVMAWTKHVAGRSELLGRAEAPALKRLAAQSERWPSSPH